MFIKSMTLRRIEDKRDRSRTQFRMHVVVGLVLTQTYRLSANRFGGWRHYLSCLLVQATYANSNWCIFMLQTD